MVEVIVATTGLGLGGKGMSSDDAITQIGICTARQDSVQLISRGITWLIAREHYPVLTRRFGHVRL
jgi:hypothetical protein